MHCFELYFANLNLFIIYILMLFLKQPKGFFSYITDHYLLKNKKQCTLAEVIVYKNINLQTIDI